MPSNDHTAPGFAELASVNASGRRRSHPTSVRWRTSRTMSKQPRTLTRTVAERLAHMTCREIILLLGGATFQWPRRVCAQRPMPVIGWLSGGSVESDNQFRLQAFREGLKINGFVEGENVVIEYRWAEGHYDRLPTLAADLVQRRVAVIVTPG